jgi:hypothetical protein
VRVNAENNCLVHAMVIAIARVNNDLNYKAYRLGRKIVPEVEILLETTDIYLSNGGGFPQLDRFEYHFRDRYKIVVYGGMNCDFIKFEGQVDVPERIKIYTMTYIVTITYSTD